MAIYAIGDVQGCFGALQRLIEKTGFTPENDKLWFVGDLVCRGSESLETLRYIKNLGDAAVVVLGNHDISLIAAHYRVLKPHPTLKKIMKADDREELIDWLRTKPILHVDQEFGWAMAHAGIYPHWNLSQAQSFAKEVEIPLRGLTAQRWLKEIYGNTPNQWSDSLRSYDRHRFIVNAFTRMRGCNADGSLNFSVNGTVKEHQSKGLYPWFNLPSRVLLPVNVVFGHWAALGFHDNRQVLALDTGCVWGRTLTAVRLDADIIQPIQVSCQ
ncbi:MAG: diadenosine tetraphosphatase [Proteobacteria bacterium]|nr:MAG: diadenosine tetraphosphatase [Pseudomonadota bacterium]